MTILRQGFGWQASRGGFRVIACALPRMTAVEVLPGYFDTSILSNARRYRSSGSKFQVFPIPFIPFIPVKYGFCRFKMLDSGSSFSPPSRSSPLKGEEELGRGLYYAGMTPTCGWSSRFQVPNFTPIPRYTVTPLPRYLLFRFPHTPLLPHSHTISLKYPVLASDIINPLYRDARLPG
jgi:hypothetical protein